MKVISYIGADRNLAFLQHFLGGLRWRSSYRSIPLLTATPHRPLIDEQITIKGRFLPPHCPVTLCAQIQNEDGHLWKSFAHYNTNAEGTVNLARDCSVGGSYLGCEPMGLFWGLQPVPAALDILSMRKKNVETPSVTLVSVLEGHVTPSEGHGNELTAITIERWYMAPGVRRIKVCQNGIKATLFLPPGPGPFPAMLDLWGLGRQLVETRSALLASRGYASLSLAYLGRNNSHGLENRMCVDHSYFQSAFQLLQNHHQVCADRVGIIGLSFGGYLSLRTAIQTAVKPSCLICVSGPTGCMMKVIDADGRTELFESDQRHWSYDDQGCVRFRESTLPVNLCPEGRVKIEHLACPLLYITGEDDQIIASKEGANLFKETLKAAGKSHLFTHWSYPGAGHVIEPPYTPHSRVSLWSRNPVKIVALYGGYFAPHAVAQEDAWKKILEFMEINLRQ
ncbi:bile acid-CoA:amino acid N-acyltransferase-like [Antennarius striatus]|uniref:bile acid-CoA:amino acid N-acyltransferase-like n=1 Tax=Antennarius striatus TaxID=241820 RepID=UPI0035AED98F